jgi:hypothetical protein
VNRDPTLPLFDGPHVPRIRFEHALARLDLRSAAADAPPEWRPLVEELADAAEDGPHPRLQRLVGLRRSAWPPLLERTWQRLVGRCLDGHGIPQVLAGEPAAAYLLRGGEHARAGRSIRRHLRHHPHDPRGWAVLAEFEPVRGAARCGFHGGAVLECAGGLIDLIREDEISPVGPWLLVYGWFVDAIPIDEVARALEAEGTLTRPPLPIPGDAHAFSWYLLEARGRPLGADAVGVLEARRRLQRISPVAFRRYLARVEKAARPA